MMTERNHENTCLKRKTPNILDLSKENLKLKLNKKPAKNKSKKKSKSIKNVPRRHGGILVASNLNGKKLKIITEKCLFRVLGAKKAKLLVDKNYKFKCILEPSTELIFKLYMPFLLDDDVALKMYFEHRGYLEEISYTDSNN